MRSEFLFFSSHRDCLTVILGQLTGCEKSSVPAKKTCG